jgi:hypothetical protein
MLFRTIPEISLAPEDVEPITRFFTDILGFEKSTHTFDGDGEVDPIVRHGEIEIRFHKWYDVRPPYRVGIVIECDDVQQWIDRLFDAGLRPGLGHARVECQIKDGLYVAFKERDQE